MPVARCSSSSTTRILGTVGLDAPRQRDRERGAAIGARALRGDRPAVALHDGTDDEEAEPGAGVAPLDLLSDAVEAVEDEREVGPRDPHALVADAQVGLPVAVAPHLD